MKRDVLVLALKNMREGEPLLCSLKTYDAIKDRVHAFTFGQKDRMYVTRREGALRRIKRVR